jgi:hypothetical protein
MNVKEKVEFFFPQPAPEHVEAFETLAGIKSYQVVNIRRGNEQLFILLFNQKGNPGIGEVIPK